MCGYLVVIRPYLSQEGCVLTLSLAFLICLGTLYEYDDETSEVQPHPLMKKKLF